MPNRLPARRGAWPPLCDKCDQPRRVGPYCERHAVWARERGVLRERRAS